MLSVSVHIMSPRGRAARRSEGVPALYSTLDTGHEQCTPGVICGNFTYGGVVVTELRKRIDSEESTIGMAVIGQKSRSAPVGRRSWLTTPSMGNFTCGLLSKHSGSSANRPQPPVGIQPPHLLETRISLGGQL